MAPYGDSRLKTLRGADGEMRRLGHVTWARTKETIATREMHGA